MPEAGLVQGVTLSRDQISWSLEGATALPVTLIYYLLEPTIRLLVELLSFVNKNIIIRVWL
jgi:hypothetical protein